jgi:sulfur-oxidizing protein SoxA
VLQANRRQSAAGGAAWRGIGLALLWAVLPGLALAGPEEDRQAFREHFLKRFPDVPVSEYVNGIYALDAEARQQWLEIEDFPPYEFAIEQGESLFEQPFADGQTYAECFGEQSPAVRQHFPRFDVAMGEVVTLELAINQCREENGEAAYDYDSEEIIALSAYMAWSSRGQPISVVIPDDPRALAAYEAGKRFYYSKRGQLNFACSDCHVTQAGSWVRADHLSASLGHPSHFPVYRSKLGRMISLHSRFYGCVRDVRARPLAQQSTEYRNLEYFMTYMSNGLAVNGPGARK